MKSLIMVTRSMSYLFDSKNVKKIKIDIRRYYLFYLMNGKKMMN